MLCIREMEGQQRRRQSSHGKTWIGHVFDISSDSDWTSGEGIDLRSGLSWLASRPLGTGMCWMKPFAPCSELCHDPHFAPQWDDRDGLLLTMSSKRWHLTAFGLWNEWARDWASELGCISTLLWTTSQTHFPASDFSLWPYIPHK